MAKVLPRVEFVWPPEEASMVSNNYDAVMNKTWYCIASSDPMVRDLDVFWEVNKWKKGKEGKVFQNHTITRKQKNRKVKDYGLWRGAIEDGFFVLKPSFQLFGLTIPLPIKIRTHWLSFPRDGYMDDVWVYYADIRNKRTFFVFGLTPHITDEAYHNLLVRLEGVHKINLFEVPFFRVSWPIFYKLGDSNEDILNSKNKAA